jgi:serine/threonine protein kinase
MRLEYPDEWRFDGIGFEVAESTVGEFFSLACDIASQSENEYHVLQVFKSAYGNPGPSSSTSWAQSDLHSSMNARRDNAARFVEAFWMAVERLKEEGIPVPSPKKINNILRKTRTPLEVDPPELRLVVLDSITEETDRAVSEAETESVPIYKLGELIGRGGYGSVFKATRSTSVAEFDFAIKILNPSIFSDSPEKSRKRFTREIRTVKLLDHRGIIPYFDSGFTQKGEPFLVMPFIQGQNLRNATEGRELEFVIPLMREVLVAVSYAHSQNVLHRDLKPSNVLVRISDNQPIILDFGCAYLLDSADSDSLTTNLVGSLGYIPPEILSNPKNRTPLHDVFSCGTILYEVLARTLPTQNKYRSLSDLGPSTQRLNEIIRKALAPANKRYQSISELIDDIDNI